MTRLCFALFVLWTIVSFGSCQDGDDDEPVVELTDKDVVKGVVECISHNVEFDRKPGAPPSLYLLNKSGERVETIDLSPLTREECNKLLLQKGFYRRSHAHEPVPEEYLHGPYRPREEL